MRYKNVSLSSLVLAFCLYTANQFCNFIVKLKSFAELKFHEIYELVLQDTEIYFNIFVYILHNRITNFDFTNFTKLFMRRVNIPTLQIRYNFLNCFDF